MSEKTWPEWTDELGNIYKPGDIIAIATVRNKSPQMVVAIVEKINRVNGSGEEITTRKWFDHEEPIQRERECYFLKSPRYYGYRQDLHSCTSACTMYLETGEYKVVPSCTVRAKPISDLRGFHRWGGEDGVNKSVTYSIPENILLIEKRS